MTRACGYEIKPLSHSTAIPRRGHCDLIFSSAPWDRQKILEIVAKYFSFFTRWRCHGVLTAIMAFPRSAQRRPHWVLVGESLRSRGALTAPTWRARSCHSASSACTRCAWRVHCVCSAFTRSVYIHKHFQTIAICNHSVLQVTSTSHGRQKGQQRQREKDASEWAYWASGTHSQPSAIASRGRTTSRAGAALEGHLWGDQSA